MKEIITDDNSITFFNKKVKDYYHSISGAKEEATLKYAKALNVNATENPIILDICFGLGYNSAAALDINPNTTIYCFENDLSILRKISKINAEFKSYNKLQNFVSNSLDGNNLYQDNESKLIMVFGDARNEIKSQKKKADFVFFDPFSPSKVPAMWTKDFFKDIYKKMRPGAMLATYSCARWVRVNMFKAGFKVTDGPIVGRTSPGTICIKS